MSNKTQLEFQVEAVMRVARLNISSHIREEGINNQRAALVAIHALSRLEMIDFYDLCKSCDLLVDDVSTWMHRKGKIPEEALPKINLYIKNALEKSCF